MLRPAAPVLVVAFGALLSQSALPSASDVTPKGSPERVWRDFQGRNIKILNGQGTLLFLTWDDQGRIVQVSKLKGCFTPKTAEAALTNDRAWTHVFAYGENGKLAVEIDCSGAPNAFVDGDIYRVDERTGTALKNHRHVNAAR